MTSPHGCTGSPGDSTSKAGTADGEAGRMGQSTAALLSAFHALAHRAGLTPAETEQVERSGDSLSPALWLETKALLVAADTAPAGTTLELGYMALLLQWLGLANERAFTELHGVGIAEALGRGRGRLGELAHAVEGAEPMADDVRAVLLQAWCERAWRLATGLPEAGPASIAALERALELCPPEGALRRGLLESLVVVCTHTGELKLADDAHRRIEALDRRVEERRMSEGLRDIAAHVLSILWCLSHEDALLGSERGLDLEVAPSRETWAEVYAAAASGRVEDIPVPHRTFAAWSARADLDEGVLRLALGKSAEVLPEMARAVDLVWRREEPDTEVPREVARHVERAATLRWVEVERGFSPLPGERPDLWYEVLNGARRPETVERLELVARTEQALGRVPDVDPISDALVHLSHAARHRARGEHDKVREHLDRAVDCARRSDSDPELQRHVEVRAADFLWQCGELGEARRRLEAVGGAEAAEALADIKARESCREALQGAERAWRDRGDGESRAALVLAHAAAGHSANAERLGAEWVERDPDDPLAWATFARLLHGVGRHRDAVEPARVALRRGHDELASRVLLGRALSRIGPEGREEATALALAVIDAHPGEGPLAGAELADAAFIAHGGGADVGRCRLADDRVDALCKAAERTEEWLGAAVARRCHGVWADDAPAWLARLAGAADEAPVELARWVVERVEALQHFRLVAGGFLFGLVQGLDAERSLFAWASLLLRFGHDLELGPEGVDPDALPEADPPGAARRWAPHLPALVGAFGEGLVRRLRASERGQRAVFGPDGASECAIALALAVFEAEHAAWIRWAGASEALKDVAAGCGDGTRTRARLKPILDLAACGDEEAIRSAAWPNRWHEAERR